MRRGRQDPGQGAVTPRDRGPNKPGEGGVVLLEGRPLRRPFQGRTAISVHHISTARRKAWFRGRNMAGSRPMTTIGCMGRAATLAPKGFQLSTIDRAIAS